ALREVPPALDVDADDVAGLQEACGLDALLAAQGEQASPKGGTWAAPACRIATSGLPTLAAISHTTASEALSPLTYTVGAAGPRRTKPITSPPGSSVPPGPCSAGTAVTESDAPGPPSAVDSQGASPSARSPRRAAPLLDVRTRGTAAR